MVVNSPKVFVAATVVAAVLVVGDAVRELVFKNENTTVVSAIPSPISTSAPKKRRAVNIAAPGLCTYKWEMTDDITIPHNSFDLIADLRQRLLVYKTQLASLKAITPDESAAMHLSAQDAACEYRRIRETMDHIESLIDFAQQQIELDNAKARENQPDEKKPKGDNPKGKDEDREEDSIPGVSDDEVVPT